MDLPDQKCESGSMVFLPPTRGLSENELAPPFLERSPHAVVGLTKPAPMDFRQATVQPWVRVCDECQKCTVPPGCEMREP